jgi:acyl-CoA synthetase (NDP forming)
MTLNPEFETAFNPRAIAVVGASRKAPIFMDFVALLKNAGYAGNIYPINPKAVGEELHGLRIYPNLTSVPEPIDLVTISVPARAVFSVLEECIAINAKNIQMYTGGFKEAGDEEGMALEEKLKEVAERGGLRILGPNCMGIHVPAYRNTTWIIFDPQPGSVAMLAQSGGHAGQFVFDAPRHGIYLSKVISYGNAAVLDSTDLLEYLATDTDTEIICMYIEGVKDGKKLTTIVKEINKTKPVIIWKGGSTESGARTAASHTGSLGGELAVWDAFFKQTGAVRANSGDELLDVAMTFRYLRPLGGNRIALVNGGGGNSVAGADVITGAGLEMPIFSEETRQELASFIPRAGAILKNPIDISQTMADLSTLTRSIECAIADPSIDAAILNISPGLFYVKAAMDPTIQKSALKEEADKQARIILDPLIKFDHENRYRKPMIMVFHEGLASFLPGQEGALRQWLLKEGIPVYFSLERASRAIGKFTRYHEFHRKTNTP